MEKFNQMENGENARYSIFSISSTVHTMSYLVKSIFDCPNTCSCVVFFFFFSILQKLRSIVAMNENLKKQEQQFRAHCKVKQVKCTDTFFKLIFYNHHFLLLYLGFQCHVSDWLSVVCLTA